MGSSTSSTNTQSGTSGNPDAPHLSGTPDDPCGEIGPVQRWAFVWFFSVIAIGLTLAYVLCGIDRRLYATNAGFLDYVSYRDNRRAATSIASDGVDERALGTLTHARAVLAETVRTNEARNAAARVPVPEPEIAAESAPEQGAASGDQATADIPGGAPEGAPGGGIPESPESLPEEAAAPAEHAEQ